MDVHLDHTIVAAHDKHASAAFLADVLDLPTPSVTGPFVAVQLADGVTLDFADRDGDLARQHYAFALDDAGFDTAFARVRARGLTYWADPRQTRAGEVREWNGTRGVYFEDPAGHLLEILTRPAAA